MERARKLQEREEEHACAAPLPDPLPYTPLLARREARVLTRTPAANVRSAWRKECEEPRKKSEAEREESEKKRAAEAEAEAEAEAHENEAKRAKTETDANNAENEPPHAAQPSCIA